MRVSEDRILLMCAICRCCKSGVTIPVAANGFSEADLGGGGGEMEKCDEKIMMTHECIFAGSVSQIRTVETAAVRFVLLG